jgi:hypothetical protein
MNQINYKSPAPFPARYTISNVVVVHGNSSMLREYFTGTVEGFMAGTPLGYRNVNDVISLMMKSHPVTTDPDIKQFGNVFAGTVDGEREFELKSMWSVVGIDTICYVFPNMKVNEYKIVVNPNLSDDAVMVNGRELKRLKKVFIVKIDEYYVANNNRFGFSPLSLQRKDAKEFSSPQEANDYVFEVCRSNIKRNFQLVEEYAYIHEKIQNRPDSVQPGFVAPQPDMVRNGGVV